MVPTSDPVHGSAGVTGSRDKEMTLRRLTAALRPFRVAVQRSLTIKVLVGQHLRLTTGRAA